METCENPENHTKHSPLGRVTVCLAAEPRRFSVAHLWLQLMQATRDRALGMGPRRHRLANLRKRKYWKMDKKRMEKQKNHRPGTARVNPSRCNLSKELWKGTARSKCETSAGPLVGGPTGCEAFPHHVSWFLVLHFACGFFRIALFLHVWCCILHAEELLHTVWLLQWGPGIYQIILSRLCALSLGPIRKAIEKLKISSLSPRHQKSLRFVQKSLQKHQK